MRTWPAPAPPWAGRRRRERSDVPRPTTIPRIPLHHRTARTPSRPVPPQNAAATGTHRRATGAYRRTTEEMRIDRGAYVYFIQAESGPVKIGVSRHPERRLEYLNTNHWEKLILVNAIYSLKPYALERAMHDAFGNYRIRDDREWFSPEILSEDEIIEQIIERVQELPFDNGILHGTRSAYTNYGCRCDECRKAEAKYKARYRRRRAILGELQKNR